MSETKKSKKKNLIIFLGLVIVSFLIIGIVISSYTPEQPSITPTEIDLSFSNWEISGEGDKKYIEDKGDYIEVYDDKYGSNIQAQLDIGLIAKGTLKFQVKTPDLQHINAFHFELKSGSEILFTIRRFHTNTRTWSFSGAGLSINLFDVDLNWHSIEIIFELNGDNSVISMKVDGITTIDSQTFSTDKMGIDNIIIASGTYIVPSLTQLKLESLLKFN